MEKRKPSSIQKRIGRKKNNPKNSLGVDGKKGAEPQREEERDQSAGKA